ncbi:hypothetical protein B4U80_13636 [Leptotrombidium deliense]|uniref:Vitellogenin domain-containing protein n=1 Tax=Leptotrombidium deliense TaxID=299467 RepID=A0A443SR83_9ACAR|nr:hypothetical protein B4U80_13636 [Leptotrombidium deliense]
MALQESRRSLFDVNVNGIKKRNKIINDLQREQLLFAFDDGLVTNVCPSVDESANAVNIKRAILSAIQSSKKEIDSNEAIKERDALGDCETIYTRLEDEKFNNSAVWKKKKMNSCSKRVKVNTFFTETSTLERFIERSVDVLRNEYECVQMFTNDEILENVECRETFGNSINYLLNNIVSLKLLNETLNLIEAPKIYTKTSLLVHNDHTSEYSKEPFGEKSSKLNKMEVLQLLKHFYEKLRHFVSINKNEVNKTFLNNVLMQISKFLGNQNKPMSMSQAKNILNSLLTELDLKLFDSNIEISTITGFPFLIESSITFKKSKNYLFSFTIGDVQLFWNLQLKTSIDGEDIILEELKSIDESLLRDKRSGGNYKSRTPKTYSRKSQTAPIEFEVTSTIDNEGMHVMTFEKLKTEVKFKFEPNDWDLVISNKDPGFESIMSFKDDNNATGFNLFTESENFLFDSLFFYCKENNTIKTGVRTIEHAFNLIIDKLDPKDFKVNIHFQRLLSSNIKHSLIFEYNEDETSNSRKSSVTYTEDSYDGQIYNYTSVATVPLQRNSDSDSCKSVLIETHDSLDCHSLGALYYSSLIEYEYIYSRICRNTHVEGLKAQSKLSEDNVYINIFELTSGEQKQVKFRNNFTAVWDNNGELTFLKNLITSDDSMYVNDTYLKMGREDFRVKGVDVTLKIPYINYLFEYYADIQKKRSNRLFPAFNQIFVVQNLAKNTKVTYKGRLKINKGYHFTANATLSAIQDEDAQSMNFATINLHSNDQTGAIEARLQAFELEANYSRRVENEIETIDMFTLFKQADPLGVIRRQSHVSENEEETNIDGIFLGIPFMLKEYSIDERSKISMFVKKTPTWVKGIGKYFKPIDCFGMPDQECISLKSTFDTKESTLKELYLNVILKSDDYSKINKSVNVMYMNEDRKTQTKRRFIVTNQKRSAKHAIFVNLDPKRKEVNFIFSDQRGLNYVMEDKSGFYDEFTNVYEHKLTMGTKLAPEIEIATHLILNSQLQTEHPNFALKWKMNYIYFDVPIVLNISICVPTEIDTVFNSTLIYSLDPNEQLFLEGVVKRTDVPYISSVKQMWNLRRQDNILNAWYEFESEFHKSTSKTFRIYQHLSWKDKNEYSYNNYTQEFSVSSNAVNMLSKFVDSHMYHTVLHFHAQQINENDLISVINMEVKNVSLRIESEYNLNKWEGICLRQTMSEEYRNKNSLRNFHANFCSGAKAKHLLEMNYTEATSFPAQHVLSLQVIMNNDTSNEPIYVASVKCDRAKIRNLLTFLLHFTQGMNLIEEHYKQDPQINKLYRVFYGIPAKVNEKVFFTIYAHFKGEMKLLRLENAFNV